MDIEFHYYMTYLIAAKAGLGPGDAQLLAYSSQYVDNNDIIFEIDKGKGSAFRNYISQTMNILKPKRKLIRIYPIFHFIPGDPKVRTAWRNDGKMHWLNTTPNSKNSNAMMSAALETKNLYRIGIAAHGYVDTWAHQNFVGYFDGFNAMDGPLETATPNIGHADARHDPDWPALVWKDPRLQEQRVDNRQRFLEAATALLEKLCRFTDPEMSETEISSRQETLRNDLDQAIGPRDQNNHYRKERIERYVELSAKAAYGDVQMASYDENAWMLEAVNEDVRGLRDKSDSMMRRFDPFTDRYTWKDGDSYRQTDWYKFQEAVKEHQNDSWSILESSNLKGLALPEL